MNKTNNSNLVIAATCILIAAATRFLPHPPNVNAVAAMALFGGAYISDKRIAFIIPLIAMLLTDMVIGFHNTMWAVYIAMAIIVFLGSKMKKTGTSNVIGFSLIASLLFFLVTNFGTWAMENFYPHTPAGLATAYVAGLPFLKNSILGDLVFNGILFGSFYVFTSRTTKATA
jgi:hypothetical protein